MAMQYALNWRVPFLRFMLKQPLIRVPFLGLAWWSLDFPFLRRYGGIGQVLYSFGDVLDTVMDVTIFYPAETLNKSEFP